MIDAEDAVKLTGERIRGDHPEWPAPRVWGEAMEALWGRGDYAGFFALLRREGEVEVPA